MQVFQAVSPASAVVILVKSFVMKTKEIILNNINIQYMLIIHLQWIRNIFLFHFNGGTLTSLYNSIDVKQEYISNSLIIEWVTFKTNPCVSLWRCVVVWDRECHYFLSDLSDVPWISHPWIPPPLVYSSVPVYPYHAL